MKPSQAGEFETRTQHSIGVHEENAVEIPLASGEEGLHPQSMAFDLVQLRVHVQEKDDENWRFRQFLKTQCNLKPGEIDQRVVAATERVWAGIDCTCALTAAVR